MMVDDRIEDGPRIAALLAAELDGLQEGPLARVGVDEPAAEPPEIGMEPFAVSVADEPIATVDVQPERVRVEFDAGVHPALEAAAEAGLAARGRGSPPATAIIEIDAGAAVKRAADVVGTVAAELPSE